MIASSQVSANLAQLQALEQRTASKNLRLGEDEADFDGAEMAPVFVTQPRNLDGLREGQRAHFEAKLEPVTDPHLQVEWLKDGQPVIVGHRFRPLHDFGYVALDIVDTISEDSGVFCCRATNLVGVAECNVRLNCISKFETQNVQL